MTAAAGGATLARVNLAELLVVLVVLGLTLSGLLTALQHGQEAYAIGMARVESQQSGRIALERLAREIRQAGAGGTAFDAIAVAERRRLALRGGLDADGTTAARGATITWSLAGTVLRRDAGGGAQPIVSGVQQLEFGYLDAGGRPTAVPGKVRTVVITLTTGPERDAAGPGLTTLQTQVRLRNR